MRGVLHANQVNTQGKTSSFRGGEVSQINMLSYFKTEKKGLSGAQN